MNGTLAAGRTCVALALICFSLTLNACGVDASADVRGHDVVVHVKKLKPGDVVTVQGIEGATGVAKFKYVTLEVPAEKLGEGQQELTVEVTRGDKTKTRKLSVEVPATALTPYARIMGCTMGKQIVGRGVYLHSPAVFATSRKQLCLLQPNGAVEAELEANSDAELTFGGKPFRVPTGKGKVMLPLTPAFEQLSLATMEKASRAAKLEVPVELTATRGGNTKKFSVTVKLDHRAVNTAIADMLLSLEADKAPSWPRTEHSGKPRGLVLFAKPHPIQVDGEERGVTHRDFSKVLVAGDSAKVSEIDLFALATPADVKRLDKCRTGPIGTYERVAMGFDVSVHDHTGKRVTSRRFPRPTQARCPRYKSGDLVWMNRGEKTRTYVYAPTKRAVTKWLDTLL